MSYFKKLTFLKVMTTVAWADGEMTHSELNLLKSFIRKFDLDKKDVAELRPYLEAPVSTKRREELFHQLIAELSSVEEKQEIIQAMETMAGTRKKKSEEERALDDALRVLCFDSHVSALSSRQSVSQSRVMVIITPRKPSERNSIGLLPSFQ